MKRALLIGCDGKYLKSIKTVLATYGISVIRHVEGRHRHEQSRVTVNIPQKTDLMIIFTDYLGHNIMNLYRDAVKGTGVKTILCKRSAPLLNQHLEKLYATETAV